MTHEEICTYEVCKLAMEKGFNLHYVSFYALEDFTAEYVDDVGEFYEVDFEKGHLYHNYPVRGLLHKDKMLSAPTQSLLQRWLREEKDIHIIIDGGFQWGLEDLQRHFMDRDIQVNIGAFGLFDTYEEALHDALLYALQNV